MQKKSPTISDDGHSVLFMEIPANQAASSSLHVAEHIIRLISRNKITDLRVPGMFPQWIGDNRFYYLASDGIHLYDIARTTSTLIVPIETRPNFKLAISHDHSILAFSNPDSRRIFLYSIKGNGLQLAPLDTMTMSGFWMVFSPDDKFMAVQTTDANDAPLITIVETSHFQQVGSSIPLPALLNERLFVTSWSR
jgi:hypothetical protein